MRSLWLGSAGACALALLAIGCPAVADGLCARNICDDDAGAIGDTNASDVVLTDPCIEAPTEPKCLDEAGALFVANAQGDDASGDGTRSKPFKTIGHAITRIEKARRRIYVCAGVYAEDLVLSAAHNGVSVFGGVSCDWKPSTDRPTIGATSIAARFDSVQGVALADLSIKAIDASAGSSIALFAAESEIAGRRLTITAGAGAPGIPGTIKEFTYPTAAQLRGVDAPDVNTGGPAKPFTCEGGAETRGGKGGNPGKQGEDGTPGPANKGAVALCNGNPSGTGGDGVPGAPGKKGDGATKLGDLLKTGWLPAAGGKGDDGGPGQGGGGGYGTNGAGGGGGAGGCGGAGGTGGGGGGSSFAVASYQSTMLFTNVELMASNAGDGGAGKAGQIGQAQGGGGGNRSDMACNGGNGARGGDGGAGGGGAGGSSAGVIYKGTKPSIDPESETKIRFGNKGSAGSGPSQNAGIEGVAQATLEVP